MAKRFVMKRKPSRPVRRKKVKHNIDLDVYGCVKTLYDEFKELEDRGIDLGNLYFDYDDSNCSCYIQYGCGCFPRIFISWEETESDEALSLRKEKYKKDLAAYNKWEKANKTKIAEFKAKELEKEKKKKDKQAKILRKALKDMQKELEELEK